MYKILIALLSIFYFLNIKSIKLKAKLNEIEKYIKYNLVGKLSHSSSLLYNRKNPEISIVISTFNGEIYLKPAIRSIQNQIFLNIEIIIVDDGSMDKSIEIIKELMEEDRRIKLLSNRINRGTLYTKTRGVLHAKGKYVMTLDHDNLYASKYVFYKLYREAEKYNLDLLGFSSIHTGVPIKNLKLINYANYFKTKVIKQPYLKKRFLGSNKSVQSQPFLCLFFIKTYLFKIAIKILGDEFINRNIERGDDTILMFILSRNAFSLKQLQEIYYIILVWPKIYSESLKFQKSIKIREREKKRCYSYLTFIEILILFTEDSDKFIAEKYLFMDFLNIAKCIYNKRIKNDTIRVFNLFLKDKYITNNTKKKIYYYLTKKYQ